MTSRKAINKPGRPRGSLRRWLCCSTALCGLTLSALSPASAETIDGTDETIIGTGGGTQSSPWTISGDLIVGELGTGTLTIEDGGAVTDTGGYIGNSSGSSGVVTVTGGGSIWDNTGDLVVGNYGDGTLTIEDEGEVDSSYGTIGLQWGSTGAVTVSGAKSSWEITDDLFVGWFGSGTLAITDGGTVSDKSAYIGFLTASAATVSGAGSEWTNTADLAVGYGGVGTLTIAAGGTVDVDGTFTVAQGSDAAGTVNIGAAATDAATAAGIVDAATLEFGAGHGTLVFNHTDTDYFFDTAITINGTPSGNAIINHLSGITTLTADSSDFNGDTYADGGTLYITGQLGGYEGTIGSSTGSDGTVVVKGTGANWTNTGNVSVGYGGDGTLTIEDGGTVSNGNGSLGFSIGSTGMALVSGAGSSWTNTAGLYVGFGSSGTLTIEKGGAVSSVIGYIGFDTLPGSTAMVTVTGEELEVDQ